MTTEIVQDDAVLNSLDNFFLRKGVDLTYDETYTYVGAPSSLEGRPIKIFIEKQYNGSCIFIGDMVRRIYVVDGTLDLSLRRSSSV